VKHRGFTLVELVIVVLILGILAAVAVTKVLNTSGDATDNGLRRTLFVVRDAIELFRAENGGALPGGSDGDPKTFKSDLATYIRGRFPKAPIGPAKGDDRVRMMNAGVPLSGMANPARAWKYDYTTGEFIFNYNAISSDGVTSYEDF
jgi:prepilin-type N-terminal cleavage/methylation domain-containing protein